MATKGPAKSQGDSGGIALKVIATSTGGEPMAASTALTVDKDDEPPLSVLDAAVEEVSGRASESPPIPAELTAPDLYLNRELTWLMFNSRVLAEAQDGRTPLLERIKFLAITDSNLDEFFMKRIGGLKQQVAAGVHQLTVDGRTPKQQLSDCVEAVNHMRLAQRDVFLDLIVQLRQHGIVIASYEELDDAQREKARDHYLKNIFPLITPLALDPAHPFPFISSLSLNLLVTIRYRDDWETLMNRIKVPISAENPRFMPIGNSGIFVPLEQVIQHNLDLLFPDMEVESSEIFRVTRNVNTELDEDKAEDLLSMIEAELRYRKFAPFVRLEIQQNMNAVRRGMLAAELGLDQADDVFETDALLGMRDLMQLTTSDIPDLHDPPHHSITNVKLHDERNIFHVIRDAGSILLHHPYESFATSVERFVREASSDPKVQAIKMTLYRTSADTEIIEYLLEAARNGKQVAVAVELKARFDEAANIQWASRLEDAGIHVTYGVLGLKTHVKAILVVRMDYNGLRRYTHIGTGNYHAGTARLYSDLGLLTCDDAIGHDLTELFNYLTSGCKPSRNYLKVLTAPRILKKALLRKIDREIEAHSQSSPGLIRFKTNALEDADITHALYRAAQAGVKIELIVRDTCRLRPGLPGISETVSVVSVVGRFLEHSRIYYFRNGGDEEFFIGSADLMTRNLESRVELVAPVEDPTLRLELQRLLDTQLRDTRNVWEMRSDGTYERRKPVRGKSGRGCQRVLIDEAEKRESEAGRLRKRRPRAIARRSVR